MFELHESLQGLNLDQYINEVSPSKCRITMTWDDCPHLSEEEKETLYREYPTHERDARSKGIPQLGSGAIYPISEERIKFDPPEDFKIPEWWPKAFAMDVGWKATAALWGAWDRDSDTVYIWSEYRQGEAEPPVHADAIRSRGSWIPGVIDPAARQRSQHDGISLIESYQNLGLKLDIADNTVKNRIGHEGGIHAVYRRMARGGLKVFTSCVMFWDEFRVYHRDQNGKIVKKNDHLLDCLRYLIMSGMGIAITEIEAIEQFEDYERQAVGNATTGY